MSDSPSTVSATGAQGADERVFLRQSTGLVRLMGTGDSVVYGAMITTLLLGAALTYLAVPYAFPGANQWLGIVITGVIGATMMVAYSMLTSAMPRSGGDYVFQSRLIHPALGVPLVLWGFVLWMGLWEALTGYLVATVAVAPFSAILAQQTGAGWLASFGTWSATSWGIVVITLVLFALTLGVLIRGIRLYVRIQSALWGLTLLSFAIAWVLLVANGHAAFVSSLDRFVARSGGGGNYYADVIAAGHAGGFHFSGYKFMDTIGVAPVAWTALAWTMWSVLNAGELKHARKLRSMNISTVGSLAIVTGLLAVTALLLVNTIGANFLGSAATAYYNGSPVSLKLPGPPYFGVLTAVLTTSPVLTALFAIGFIAVGIQLLIGIAWGSSRVILALAFDRMLPPRLADVSPRFHTPVKAIVAFFAISVVWVFLYNKTGLGKYTLAVTLTSILVYMGTMVAAVVFPFRAPEVYKASPAARYRLLGMPLISVLGVIAFLFNALMVWFYLDKSALGVNSTDSLLVIAGSYVLCVVYYLARRLWLERQGFEPSVTFALIPPD
jgi:APA family basic amino acid/polyamine antiporter